MVHSFLDFIGWTKLRHHFSEKKRRKQQLASMTTCLLQGLNGLKDPGDKVEFEAHYQDGSNRVVYWRFVKTPKWFDFFESEDGQTFTQQPFRKPEPEHYVIDGIPVSVGMDTDDWVEAMLG